MRDGTESRGGRDDPANRPPRVADLTRHLDDLRTGTCEGAREWDDRVAYFERATELLDPVVRAVLAETDLSFLEGTGQVTHHSGQDKSGGRWARWDLYWPDQRQATSREGGAVQPVQVMAIFGRGSNHPHLSGTTAGLWPCQVSGTADAQRQEAIVRAIVEAELHQRIYEGRWRIIPTYTRQHPEE